MHPLLTKFLDILFPPTCLHCGTKGAYLCAACKRLLNPHLELCPYCHKYSSHFQTCLSCKIDSNHVLEGVIIAFCYNGVVKQLVRYLKYHHKKDMGGFLADRLAILLQTNPKLSLSPETTLIAWIPSHWYREHFVKGYNQAQVLAEHLWDSLGITSIPLLKKPQATASQVKLAREQRMVNIHGAFAINPEISLQGNETILLVDDITTTGTTINEAALVLKAKWPKLKVWGVTVARHC